MKKKRNYNYPPISFRVSNFFALNHISLLVPISSSRHLIPLSLSILLSSDKISLTTLSPLNTSEVYNCIRLQPEEIFSKASLPLEIPPTPIRVFFL